MEIGKYTISIIMVIVVLFSSMMGMVIENNADVIQEPPNEEIINPPDENIIINPKILKLEYPNHVFKNEIFQVNYTVINWGHPLTFKGVLYENGKSVDVWMEHLENNEQKTVSYYNNGVEEDVEYDIIVFYNDTIILEKHFYVTCYTKLSDEACLSELEPVHVVTWKSLRLHVYWLQGGRYIIDGFNVTVDSDGWAGVNQCLFYMSDYELPEYSKELWQVRFSCKSSLKPWVIDRTVSGISEDVRMGRYFIIGFTNNHDFTASGTIRVRTV